MVNAQDDDGFKTEQIRHMPGHGPRHMMMERMYLDNGTDTQSSPMMAQNTTTLDNQTSFNVSIVLGAISRTTDAYQPNPAYIQSGQAVIWTNNDNFIHTVTHRSMNVDIQSSPPPLFDSGIMDRGQSFAHTFNTEGRYDYYCTIHPWMVGQIYVTSISSSTSDTN